MTRAGLALTTLILGAALWLIRSKPREVAHVLPSRAVVTRPFVEEKPPAANDVAPPPAPLADRILEARYRRRDEALERAWARDAARLTPAELEALAVQTLDRHLDGDRRWAALTTLELAGAHAAASLAEVARAPLPEGASIQREMPLKISALEAIDKLAEDGVDVTDSLAQIANGTRDPNFGMLARVALLGVEQGRPGKLGRLVRQLTGE